MGEKKIKITISIDEDLYKFSQEKNINIEKYITSTLKLVQFTCKTIKTISENQKKQIGQNDK
jgi:hypothetical protein